MDDDDDDKEYKGIILQSFEASLEQCKTQVLRLAYTERLPGDFFLPTVESGHSV